MPERRGVERTRAGDSKQGLHAEWQEGVLFSRESGSFSEAPAEALTERPEGPSFRERLKSAVPAANATSAIDWSAHMLLYIFIPIWESNRLPVHARKVAGVCCS